jgi:hypothetical protein
MLEWTPMAPPINCTMWRQMQRPSPLPRSAWRSPDRNYEMWTAGTVHEMVPGAPLLTDPELIFFEQARTTD